jgi:hypothetical protein
VPRLALGCKLVAGKGLGEVCGGLLSYCDLRFRTVLFGHGTLVLNASFKPENSSTFLSGSPAGWGTLSLEGEAKSEICTFDVTHL